MTAARPNPNASNLKRWTSLPALLGIGLSMVALFLVIRAVDFATLKSAFQQVSGLGILLAFICVMINNLAKAARWRIMVGVEVYSFSSILLLHLQGQLWNLVYPVRLGDLGRTFMLEGMQQRPVKFSAGDHPAPISTDVKPQLKPNDSAFTLGTVASEKILDTLAYILLIAIVLIRIPLPDWLNRTSLLLAICLAVGVGVGLAVICRLKRRSDTSHGVQQIEIAWLPAALNSFLRGATTSFEPGPMASTRERWHGYSKWQRPIWLLLLTAVVWLTAVLNNYLVLAAIGSLAMPLAGNQAWDASLLVLVALLAGLSLPAPPLRIGIFEYLCILSLSVFGVGGELALVFGLVLHSVTMLPVIAGGLLAGIVSIRNVRAPILQSSMENEGGGYHSDFQPHTVGNPDDRRDREPYDAQIISIMGISITAAPMTTILEIVTTWAARPLPPNESTPPRCIGYANAHTLNIASKDILVREYMQQADLIYADGVGVTWAAQFLHRARAPKMTGRMWIEQLAMRASRMRLRVFLLGGEPGIAALAGRCLLERWPDITIVGTQDGFFSEIQETQILDKIHRAQPHILLVGMGSPHQEAFVLRHKNKLPVSVIWVVGALFDYLAGREQPAPDWLSIIGLEWFWRLVLNPPGKWKRYLIGIPLFTYRIVRQKLTLMIRK